MKVSREHRRALVRAGQRVIRLSNGTFRFTAGWLEPEATPAHEAARAAIPEFSQSAADLSNTGQGQTILLPQAIKHVWGQDLDIEAQADGDCVGFAFAGCVDALACGKAIDHPTFKTSYKQRISPESVYALSRIEYGEPNPPAEGSHGYWAVRALINGGCLPRNLVPPEGGETRYLRTRVDDWGARGLPDDLEPAAKQNRILAGAKVRTFEQARDAVANGYPVAVSTFIGFSPDRDAEGFGVRLNRQEHCMRFMGCRVGARPGLLCVDSLRKYYRGPQGWYDIPNDSFWIDAGTCTEMIAGGDDSYALCGYQPVAGDPLFPPITAALRAIITVTS